MIGFVLVLSLLLVACNSNQQTASSDSDQETGEIDEARIKKGIAPQADKEVAVIETDFGNITIELYSNIAPQMVGRFKQLIRENYYQGTTFHRIDPRLGIIQGGDALSRDDNPMNDGTGGSAYPNVPGEFSDIPFDRGTVGAARAASPDSANSQFYITLKRQPNFDRRYTVFGRVVQGLNNADVISTAPVAPGTERPADPIPIKRITLQ